MRAAVKTEQGFCPTLNIITCWFDSSLSQHYGLFAQIISFKLCFLLQKNMVLTILLIHCCCQINDFPQCICFALQQFFRKMFFFTFKPNHYDEDLFFSEIQHQHGEEKLFKNVETRTCFRMPASYLHIYF